jgi:hypothetical protein
VTAPPRRWPAFAVAGVALVAARMAVRARLPEDYDAVGFLRALDRYDLATLQPHFPGYPVYVAAARLLCALGLSPLAAATATSSLASAATGLGLARLGLVGGGARAAWMALALWAAALGPTLSGGAALSDATATALVAWAFAALSWPGARAAFVAAALLALGLGARASYWPFSASFALVLAHARPTRARAAGLGGVVGAAAWAIPFVAVVGPRALWTLGRQHLAGHFAVWGGSIVTRPDVPARVYAWARDLAYDGLFPHPLALLAALATVWWLRPRPLKRMTRLALVVAAPYGLWALLAQNVLEQPRHLLPLVAAATLALSLIAQARLIAGVALVAAALASSLPLAVARVRTPPAAAQLATWLCARDAQALVYGVRATRVIEWSVPTLRARPRGWLSEVDSDLERLDIVPRDVYVTSEVEPDPTRAARLTPLARFCRDPRLDRQSPCLGLLRYKIRP